jgi:hypothetical protein
MPQKSEKRAPMRSGLLVGLVLLGAVALYALAVVELVSP